ncbi:uncharacterized protein LAJ45_11553 [Morchella importuna]|uniref:uncharacterized protein n=1 Tax=Morchella importuna TaxID=1174673 RepID=UPI001E8D8EE8|nr:uncharacterized protein LAJ45_11553 [Morchella importuna]KAH8144454.1 hypothetical protein LAJ45_11553 [Morchella importuna]
MPEQVSSVQAQLQSYAQRDDLGADEMEDIEGTNPAMPPNFLEDIQRAINGGRLSIARMPTPVPVPNPIPPISSQVYQAEDSSPDDAIGHWRFTSPSSESPSHPLAGGLARPPDNLLETKTTTPRHQSGVVPLGSPQPGRNPQPEGNPGGENQNPEPAGNGGGNGIVPPVVGAPNPGGDSESSDSEPEYGDRQGWRGYFRKKLEKQQKELLASMAQFMRSLAPSHPSAASRAREPKAPSPTKFNSKADNVETFVRQCENVFSIESQSFTSNEIGIRYAGNLMEGDAPVKWYEAYHNSIDQASANRIAGMPVVLDERWKCWDSFVDALRAAFGEAISRDDAVAN